MATKKDEWTEERILKELTRLGKKRNKMEERIAKEREELHAEIQNIIDQTPGLRIPREAMFTALQVSRGRLYDRYLANIPE